MRRLPRAGLDGQAEAGEPSGVRGVAAEPGMQPAGPGPRIGAADPRGVPDRQRAGTGLPAVIRRDLPGQVAAQLPERAPQPADDGADRALRRSGPSGLSVPGGCSNPETASSERPKGLGGRHAGGAEGGEQPGGGADEQGGGSEAQEQGVERALGGSLGGQRG
jgi:hypothetical protein